MNWPMVELGELALLKGGSVNPAKHPENIFELYSIPAFDSGLPEVLQGKDIGSSKKKVRTGDVLLSRIVPHIRRAWVVGEKLSAEQIASGEWIVFRTDEADAGYLRHWLTSDIFHRQFMTTVSGVGGSLLRARPEYVFNIEIPLPPLEEQKRIAAILGKADIIRRKRQRVIELADQFLLSVFLDMFGDPITNPKSFEIVRLENVCVDGVGVKAGPFGSTLKKEDYIDAGFRIYGQEQVIYGSLEIGDYYIDEERFRKLESCSVQRGDVLVSLVGSLGKTLVIPKQFEPGIINPRLVRLRPNRKRIFGEYIQDLFKQERFQWQLLQHSHGGTMPIINAGILKGLNVALPPLHQQERYVGLRDRAQLHLARLERDLYKCEELYGSLVSSFFNGTSEGEPA